MPQPDGGRIRQRNVARRGADGVGTDGEAGQSGAAGVEGPEQSARTPAGDRVSEGVAPPLVGIPTAVGREHAFDPSTFGAEQVLQPLHRALHAVHVGRGRLYRRLDSPTTWPLPLDNDLDRVIDARAGGDRAGGERDGAV